MTIPDGLIVYVVVSAIVLITFCWIRRWANGMDGYYHLKHRCRCCSHLYEYEKCCPKCGFQHYDSVSVRWTRGRWVVRPPDKDQEP